MGSLVGSGALTVLFFVIIAFSGGLDGIEFVFLVGLVALVVEFVIALVALGVFGLPVTLLLRHLGKESRNAYLTAGLIGGGAIPLVLFGAWYLLLLGSLDLWAGLIYAVPGALTGGATAWFWWKYARKDAEFEEIEPVLEVFE